MKAQFFNPSAFCMCFYRSHRKKNKTRRKKKKIDSPDIIGVKRSRTQWNTPSACSWLYYMGKNEILLKLPQSLNSSPSQHSHYIQLCSNIAREALVWVFLPSSLLFKVPRTQWFDNDLIARYFQFEYSKTSQKYLYLRDIRHQSACKSTSFNRILHHFTLWLKNKNIFLTFYHPFDIDVKRLAVGLSLHFTMSFSEQFSLQTSHNTINIS